MRSCVGGASLGEPRPSGRGCSRLHPRPDGRGSPESSHSDAKIRSAPMLVRLSVDAAVIFYGAAAASILCIPQPLWRSGATATRGARLLWTCAWLTYCVHVALAFHFAHHWSH